PRTIHSLDLPNSPLCLVGYFYSRRRIRWLECISRACNRVDFRPAGGAWHHARWARGGRSFVGQNRLRVASVDQIYALVIIGSLIIGVHAMEDDIVGFRAWLYALDNPGQRNAFPFGDGAPSFDAIVTRDLSPRRHGLKLRKRKLHRLRHQTGNFQSPL